MIYLIYGLIAMLAFGIGYIFYVAYKALTVEPKCHCSARLPGQGYQPCGCGKSGDPKDPPRRP